MHAYQYDHIRLNYLSGISWTSSPGYLTDPSTSSSVNKYLKYDSGQLLWDDPPGGLEYFDESYDSNTNTTLLIPVHGDALVLALHGTHPSLALSDTGGTRGIGSVDLQIYKSNDSQVAVGDHSVISGGINNTANGDTSTIGGGRQNRTDGDYSTVSGGHNNDASDLYTSIGGGHQNNTNGTHSTIAGGNQNNTGGDYASVGGGNRNTAIGTHSVISGGNNNSTLIDHCTIGGGQNNSVSEINSTISGGNGNIVSSKRSVIGGGHENLILHDDSSIGGGYKNTIRDQNSVISGGINNHSNGNASTIGGGNANTTTGNRTTIGGGYQNIVGFADGTISGGYQNSTGNQNASVGGGFGNHANGNASSIPGGRGILMSYNYGFSTGRWNKHDHLTPRIFSIGNGDNTMNRTNAISADNDGVFYCHSVDNAGADYAEYYESLLDEKIPIGTTVLLVDGYIRPCNRGEIPIGVISDTAGITLNTASEDWHLKYIETAELIDVVEHVTEIVSKEAEEEVFEDGRWYLDKVIHEIEMAIYDSVDILDRDTNEVLYRKQVPRTKITGVTERIVRKINPDYDNSKKYLPRSHRPEWNIVGLLGKCKILKDQPIDDRWKLISRNDDEYDWYLIR